MSGPMHTLIIGGQKSGKSRHAEHLAARWLAQPGHAATLIATAQAWDDEMRARIARHQQERLQRAPGLHTVEEPLQLPAVIAERSRADTLLVVDCLTLWLTNWLMPITLDPAAIDDAVHLRKRRQRWQQARADLLGVLAQAPGPVVFVSNEMGWGVMPLGRAVRAFADELGALNQMLAAHCPQVLLMAAGLPMPLKSAPPGV